MTFDIANLERALAGDEQFAVLAQTRHSGANLRALLTSREFYATLRRTGRTQVFLEHSRSLQPFFDDFAAGRITQAEFVERCGRRIEEVEGLPRGSLGSSNPNLLRLARQVQAATAEGITLRLYDAEGMVRSGRPDDPIFRCFSDPAAADRLRRELGETRFRELRLFAEMRERFAQDRFGSALIRSIAGGERAVVIPGALHTASPSGLDEQLGRSLGSHVRVINLYESQAEFHAYPRDMRERAELVGLNFSQPPHLHIDLSSGSILQPTAEWQDALSQARASWRGPTCN